jgi:Septum formation
VSAKVSPLLRRSVAGLAIGLAAVALTGCSVIGGLLNNGKSDVFTIKVGNCLNAGTTDGTVSEVPIVDCEKPHDTEAFSSIIMTDDSFPGDKAVTDRAEQECYDAFEPFAGASYDDSPELDVSYYFPTETSWKGGDREILCLIYSIDADGNPIKSTGSLKGAAQ